MERHVVQNKGGGVCEAEATKCASTKHAVLNDPIYLATGRWSQTGIAAGADVVGYSLVASSRSAAFPSFNTHI